MTGKTLYCTYLVAQLKETYHANGLVMEVNKSQREPDQNVSSFIKAAFTLGRGSVSSAASFSCTLPVLFGC